MITRGTLINPELLNQALNPNSHIGYLRLDEAGNSEVTRLAGYLGGNCGLLSTIGTRLIYTQLPGRDKDFYPAQINVDQLIAGESPFWIYGDHKHGRACDGCGAICPQNVLTLAGRELLTLQGVSGVEAPDFIRSLAYRELGIALLGKRIKELTHLG